MRFSWTHKIQEQWYDQANEKVLKLENIYSHWRYLKEQNIEASEQEENENIALDDETSSSTHENVSDAIIKNISNAIIESVSNAIDVEIFETSSSSMTRFSIIRETLLRI